MKKKFLVIILILLSIVSVAAEKKSSWKFFNVYLKAGALPGPDIFTNLGMTEIGDKMGEYEVVLTSTGGNENFNSVFLVQPNTTFEGLAEITLSLSDNFEAGAGIGYINNSTFRVKQAPEDKMFMVGDGSTTISYIPVYGTVKLNILKNGILYPYMTVRVGSSYTEMKKLLGNPISKDTIKLNEKESISIQTSSGLYVGGGIGIEMLGFLFAELNASMNTTEVSWIKEIDNYSTNGNYTGTTVITTKGNFTNPRVEILAGLNF